MQTQKAAESGTGAEIGGPKQQNQSITGGVRLSIFGSATAQNPLQVKTLEEIVSDIKSEKLKTRIDHLRSLPKTAYDAAKKNLPAVVFGGEYSDRKHLIKSSGLAVVDIDDFRERGKDLRAVKAALASDPHVAVVFTSPSGDGLKVVVKIGEPGTLDAEAHKARWKGAAELVKSVSGVQYCETPTVNWLCFMSADADLIYRPDPKTLPALPVVSIEPVRHVQADVSTPTRKGLPTPAEGYVRAALHHACDAVRGTLPGGRRPLLVKEAFALGGYAELDHAEAADALVAAAAEAGLDEALSRPIIEEQLRAGALKPRQIPESPGQATHGGSVAGADSIDWPDPVPISGGLAPVKPFDMILLPDSLRQWGADIQELMNCPGDFVGVPIMTALASVVGRKVTVRPQARTGWSVVPNLWGMLIGTPGTMKSPAMNETLRPLNRLVAAAIQEHKEAMIEYNKATWGAEARKDAAQKQARALLAKNPTAELTLPDVETPKEPPCRRYIANDTSCESLGELLMQNENGLLVFRDELVSLLRHLDREDQAGARGFYLTAWNGDSDYTFDRIMRGLNRRVAAVCLSLLGSTQPGRISAYVQGAVTGGAGDDGLIQRFGLMVWPDDPGEWRDQDRFPDTAAKNQAFEVFKRLDALTPESAGASQDMTPDGEPDGLPYLRFDDAARELFLEWRYGLETRLRGHELHAAMEAHLAKYRKLVPGLALITHLANGGVGPVTIQAVMAALAWAEYLESHAARVYGCASNAGRTAALLILKKVRTGALPMQFSSRDVWYPGWSGLSDRETVKAGLDYLIETDWLRSFKIATQGRPSTLYMVNPKGVSR